MADSFALRISKAVEARFKLTTITGPGGTFTPPTGLTVEREIIGTITPRQVRDGPVINVSMAQELPSVRSHHKSPLTERILELLITVAAGADNKKNSDALDPPCNWVIQSLQAEPTLNKVCHWISEEGSESIYTTWGDSENVVAARELKIRFGFHTRTDDPTARS